MTDTLRRAVKTWFMLAILVSGHASAEVYFYTGKNFTNITGVLHTTDMRITGFIATDSPIPPGRENVDITSIVNGWSFNDGVQTIDHSNGVVYPDGRIIVSTDSKGGISEIALRVFRAPVGTAVGDTDDLIWISIYGVDLADIGAVCDDVFDGVCTTWPFNENAHVRAEGTWVTSAGFYDPDFQINSGLSDAWYNPATNGQGFFLTVFPEVEQVFIAWFTYDTGRPSSDATAVLGEPGHRWLTAQGPFRNRTATLTLFVTEGGVFDSPEPTVTTDPSGDGALTVEFVDCASGLVRYQIASLGLSGEIPIQRVAQDNIALCEMLNRQ